MASALLLPLLMTVGCAGFWLFFKSVEVLDRI